MLNIDLTHYTESMTISFIKVWKFVNENLNEKLQMGNSAILVFGATLKETGSKFLPVVSMRYDFWVGWHF